MRISQNVILQSCFVVGHYLIFPYKVLILGFQAYEHGFGQGPFLEAVGTYNCRVRCMYEWCPATAANTRCN